MIMYDLSSNPHCTRKKVAHQGKDLIGTNFYYVKHPNIVIVDVILNML
jgi:hypothetical protein